MKLILVAIGSAALLFAGLASAASIRGDVAFGHSCHGNNHWCITTGTQTTTTGSTTTTVTKTVTIDASSLPTLKAVTNFVATTFQWRTCDSGGANCSDITGATSSTYTLTSADSGLSIRVVADGVTSAPYGAILGQVLYAMNFDDGLRIPSGWTEGSNGQIALDSSTYWSSPNSDKFTLPQGSDRAEIYSLPGNNVIHNHSDYYYKSTYMFPVGWTVDHMNLDQINMMSINSSCVSIEAGQSINGVMGSPYTFALINTGDFNNFPAGTYYSGDPQFTNGGRRPTGIPGPLYIQNPGEIVLGRWYQTITHVHWSTDRDGVVEVWLREKTSLGATPSAWVKKVDFGPVGSSHGTQFNAPTLQIGTQTGVVGTVTLANIDGYSSNVADIVGGYIGVGQTSPTFSWYRDDWAKATTFDAAAAS